MYAGSKKNSNLGSCLFAIGFILALLIVNFISHKIELATNDFREEVVSATVTKTTYILPRHTKKHHRSSKHKVTLEYQGITVTINDRSLYKKVEKGDHVDIYLVSRYSKKTGKLNKQFLSKRSYTGGEDFDY